MNQPPEIERLINAARAFVDAEYRVGTIRDHQQLAHELSNTSQAVRAKRWIEAVPDAEREELARWCEGMKVFARFDTAPMLDRIAAALRSAPAGREPCCGEYATCTRACVPHGRWLGEHELPSCSDCGGIMQREYRCPHCSLRATESAQVSQGRPSTRETESAPAVAPRSGEGPGTPGQESPDNRSGSPVWGNTGTAATPPVSRAVGGDEPGASPSDELLSAWYRESLKHDWQLPVRQRGDALAARLAEREREVAYWQTRALRAEARAAALTAELSELRKPLRRLTGEEMGDLLRALGDDRKASQVGRAVETALARANGREIERDTFRALAAEFQ